MLCVVSLVKKLYPMLSLSIQVYKWIPENRYRVEETHENAVGNSAMVHHSTCSSNPFTSPELSGLFKCRDVVFVSPADHMEGKLW